MACRAVPSRLLLLPLPLFSVLLWVALPSVLCGCGPVTFAIDARGTERVVAQARSENASYHAPYELAFAEAYLNKANEEAAQGAYEEAIQALAVAEAYGRRALTRSAQPGSLDR